MGDEMSLNNFSWMGYNPNAMRTIGSNNWQWDMFGTYPNDSLSANNDYNQFKFDFNTSIFLDDTARMSAMMTPMVKMLQASIAEWSQKSLMNISSDYPDLTIRDRRTKSDKTDGTDGKSDKIDGTKVIKEGQINNALNAMGAKDSRMGSKEITYIDKNGKEQTTKLLQRLIQLSKDYQDNPDNPEKIEISESNYKLLWDIAGKYAKTGELSREDYATLIDIAINPGGPGAYKKGGKEDESTNPGIRPKKNQAVIDSAASDATDNYKSLATEIKDSLYIAGTDTEKLNNVKTKINKDNVVEISNYFFDRYGEDQGENIIDAIFDDIWGWGCGNHWYNDDDAKPYVNRLSDSLIERAEALVKTNPKLAEQDIKALKDACNALKESKDDKNIKRYWGLTKSHENVKSETKKDISAKYDDLLRKLTKVETSIYGEPEPTEPKPQVDTQG